MLSRFSSRCFSTMSASSQFLTDPHAENNCNAASLGSGSEGAFNSVFKSCEETTLSTVVEGPGHPEKYRIPLW